MDHSDNFIAQSSLFDNYRDKDASRLLRTIRIY